jgi:glycosyltransferase involved in cell wall biosynthesis
MRRVLAYRQKLGREAEMCVVPQQSRFQKFLQSTNRTKPTYCVWNCPSRDEIIELSPEQNRQHFDKKRQLILYYHGSITPDRIPGQIIVAVTRLKDAIRLRLVGYETVGSVGYLRELTAIAANSGASGAVEVLGTIPFRSDLLRNASTAHVGIVLMPKQSRDINMEHMVGASNKAFDYMACGLPLLVTNSPDWLDNFVRPGYARACDPTDPDSIETELRWYLEHPAERRAMGELAREKIRHAWNYDTVFAGVLAQIESFADDPKVCPVVE